MWIFSRKTYGSFVPTLPTTTFPCAAEDIEGLRRSLGLFSPPNFSAVFLKSKLKRRRLQSFTKFGQKLTPASRLMATMSDSFQCPRPRNAQSTHRCSITDVFFSETCKLCKFSTILLLISPKTISHTSGLN